MGAALALAAPAHAQTGTIREIVVRGNVRVSRETILIQLREKVGGSFLQATLDEDQNTLLDTGFFSSVKLSATPLEGEAWRITVDVAEYPEIREIRVVGNKAVPTDDILKALALKPGGLFNLKDAKPAADAVERLYTGRGLFARVVRFQPSTESPGTIEVQIAEAVVGNVTIVGNTATQKRVIEKLVRTRPGDPFNADKWRRDLSRLYNTSYFEDVQDKTPYVPRDVGGDDLVFDFLGGVKEARTGVFNVGVALDPRNSFAGLLSIADTNFRGTGQSISLNYTQATIGGGASTSLAYTNPFVDDRNTTFRFELYSRLNFRFANTGLGTGGGSPTNDNRYTERRTGATLGVSRLRNDFDTTGVSARYETISTSNLGTNTSNNFIQQDGQVGAVNVSSIVDRRDIQRDAARGTFTRFDLEPGVANITDVGGLANPTNTRTGSSLFAKASTDLRAYFSKGKPRRDFKEQRRVVALRFNGGGIGGDIPFFEQYFLGGADTLRGYPEDRFWGKNFFLGQAEYRVPVPGQDAFSVVSFLDVGSAWGGFPSVNDFTQSSTPYLRYGYGLGIRLRTPIGPIKLDYGFNREGGSRAHFSIGTSF